jgi:hypothetical protein
MLHSFIRRALLTCSFFFFSGLATIHAAQITAAIAWPGNKVQFFFSDGTYARFDRSANRMDPGYPAPINNDKWPGLEPYARMITAGFASAGKAYFFLNDGRYIRYDIAGDHVDAGYPNLVDHKNWPGVHEYGKQIIGTLPWEDNKVQFFFSNGTYARFDMGANRVDDGYPKRTSNEEWSGLGPYARSFGGMFTVAGKKAYFFLRNGTYLRYDIPDDHVDSGYPKRTDDANWPGLGGIVR